MSGQTYKANLRRGREFRTGRCRSRLYCIGKNGITSNKDQAGAPRRETSMQETRIHIVRVPIWGIALVAALVLSLGIVAAIAAAGIFLIVFPLVLIAAAIALVLGWLRVRLGGQGYSM